MPTNQSITILLAEDDADDRFLIQTAFVESSIRGQLKFVNNGDQLMDYLLRRGQYEDESGFPHPNVIVLDLNMPRKDGREALREIRHNPALRNVPIVVLTTSSLRQDKKYCLEMGVADYIVKPNSYTELLGIMKTLRQVCKKGSSPPEEIRPRFVDSTDDSAITA